MTPQELDRQIRIAQAADRRERDALLRRDRVARRASNIATGLDTLCSILRVADEALTEYVGPLSDLHEIEISSEADMVKVTANAPSYVVWINEIGSDWQAWIVLTTEGYCKHGCDCEWCQELRCTQERRVH